MNLTSFMAFLQSFAPVLEPVLLNLEQNNVQPEIKALIAKMNPNSDLAQLLTAIDAGLDAFIQAEIKKI